MNFKYLPWTIDFSIFIKRKKERKYRQTALFQGSLSILFFQNPVKAFNIGTALLVPKVTLDIRLNKQQKRKMIRMRMSWVIPREVEIWREGCNKGGMGNGVAKMKWGRDKWGKTGNIGRKGMGAWQIHDWKLEGNEQVNLSYKADQRMI